jgi:hypothetical protein
MNAIHARRLLKLADFLDELPRQKFDFATLVREDGKPVLEALKAGKTECGTVACAIGWTPAVFPRLAKWGEVRGFFGVRKIVLPTDAAARDKSSREALILTAAKLFGLSEDDTDTLFVPDYYERRGRLRNNATPKRVAKHIRRFVEKARRG